MRQRAANCVVLLLLLLGLIVSVGKQAGACGGNGFYTCSQVAIREQQTCNNGNGCFSQYGV